MIKKIAIPALATLLNACATNGTDRPAPTHAELHTQCTEAAKERSELITAYKGVAMDIQDSHTKGRPPRTEQINDLDYLSMQIQLLENQMEKTGQTIRKNYPGHSAQECRFDELVIDLR